MGFSPAFTAESGLHGGLVAFDPSEDYRHRCWNVEGVCPCFIEADYTFDDCCSPVHGPEGDPRCWDRFHNYVECCTPAQRRLATTSRWSLNRTFPHNAYAAAQVAKDSWWFKFPWEPLNLCPDLPHLETVLSVGLPSEVTRVHLGPIGSHFSDEPQDDLWVHVREACQLSSLHAIALYMAALQIRLGLRHGPGLPGMLRATHRHYQELMRGVLGRMRDAAMVVDARGRPLLRPEEAAMIWQRYALPGRKSAGLSAEVLQADARDFFQRTHAALRASEVVYYDRLKPLLLEGCGGVCDPGLRWKAAAPLSTIPPFCTRIHCGALLRNAQLSEPARLWPPPKTVPRAFGRDFRQGGWLLRERYVHQSRPNNVPDPAQCAFWSSETVDALVRLFREPGDGPLRWPHRPKYVGYDSKDFNATARFLGDLRASLPLLGGAAGGHWLVLGSWSPWVEAALLATGVASAVTTLEFTHLASCPDVHRSLTPLVHASFAAQNRSAVRYDGFVQFSSVADLMISHSCAIQYRTLTSCYAVIRRERERTRELMSFHGYLSNTRWSTAASAATAMRFTTHIMLYSVTDHELPSCSIEYI